eukprot:SAG25_NODE_6239_length_576_cov_0.651992_3_plen_20_part_01
MASPTGESNRLAVESLWSQL